MRRKSGILNNIDWPIIALYMMLTFVGVLFIYSTTYNPLEPSVFQLDTSYGKQIMFWGISLIVALVIIILDSKFYTTFAYIIYGLVMLLLVSVLIFGVTINGSKSWFSLGFFKFQPAELAKFATALALAKYMTGLNVNLEQWSSKRAAAFIIGLPVGLILLQGDVGSALVFTGFIFLLHREGLETGYLIVGFGLIFFSIMALLYNPFSILAVYAAVLLVAVFYNKKLKQPILGVLAWIGGLVAGSFLYFKYAAPKLLSLQFDEYLPIFIVLIVLLIVGSILYYKRKSWLLPMLGLFVAVGLYTFSVDFIFNNVLQTHHRNRINLILGKIEDQRDIGYNLFQSKIAIGSGGVTGKGYLEGTQTMFNFVPEQSTDFIFTSIAEELGFMGSLLVVGLFALLLLRIIQIAERQRSRFARVYGYGVACVFLIHYSVNIAMTIGLAPVIGIPLPFLSYGGSSLLSFTILLFVLIKLDTRRLDIFR